MQMASGGFFSVMLKQLSLLMKAGADLQKNLLAFDWTRRFFSTFAFPDA
jgi:hypothetical protein